MDFDLIQRVGRFTVLWLITAGLIVPRADAQQKPSAPLARTDSAKSEPGVRVLLNSGHTVTDRNPRLFLTRNGEFAISYYSDGASSSNDFRLHLWHLPTRRKVAALSVNDLPGLKSTYEERNCAVSGNGRFLLASSGQSTFLYDVYRSRTVAEFPGTFGETLCDPFAEDGSIFWLSDEDRKQCTIVQTEPPAVVTTIADIEAVRGEFSPDGRRLLLQSYGYTQLIGTDGSRIVKRFDDAEIPESSTAFCAESGCFALSIDDYEREGGRNVAGKNNGVAVFDRDGDLIRRIPLRDDLRTTYNLLRYSLSPDARYLALSVANSDTSAAVYDVASGKAACELGANILALAFADAKDLLVGFRVKQSQRVHNQIDIVEVTTGKRTQHHRVAERLSYVDDDDLVSLRLDSKRGSVTAQRGTSVCHIWPLANPAEDRQLEFFSIVGQPTQISFASDGSGFLIGRQSARGRYGEDANPLLTYWNSATGNPIFRSSRIELPPPSSGQSARGLTLSSRGRHLFVPAKQGFQLRGGGPGNDYHAGGHLFSLSAMDTSTHAVKLPPGPVIDSVFCDDDRTLLVATVQEVPGRPGRYTGFQLTVIDVESGRIKNELKGRLPRDSFGQLVISPSGKFAATTRNFHPNAADPNDFDLHVWRIDEWDEGPVELSFPRLAGGRRPYKPRFSDSDQLLLLGHYGVSKVNYENGTEQYIGPFLPKTYKLTVRGTKAVYISDSTAAGERHVGVADLVAGRVIAKMPDSVADRIWLDPEGKHCFSLTKDGWCEVLDAQTLKLLCRFVTFSNNEDWIVVTPDGLFDGSHAARQQVFFRVGGGLNVVPVDRFFQDFYYPGLLAAVLKGEQPAPQIQVGEQLPPLLAIDSPKHGGEVDTAHVTIGVTATDQGGGIKGPTLRHNGARLIGAVRSTERIKNEVHRIFTVDLIEGENVLEVMSASADGSFQSEPARLVLKYGKKLPKSRLHVLVAGIDDYVTPSLKMNYAVSDAERIARVFIERGDSLYENVNVIALRNADATSAGILNGIQSLAAEARPQDTVVVFLAGHGSLVDQTLYFLPHDFQDRSGSLEDDIRQSGLAAARIGDELSQVPALKRMIVFDTGQSGKAVPVKKSARSPFAFRGAVERLSRAQGAFTIAAAPVSDRSTEVAELEHGVLSYSFLAGLKAVDAGPLVDQWVTPAGNDRVAQAMELFSFASSRSRQLGRRYFGEEQDVQYSSLGMTFPVLPVDAGESAGRPTDLSAATIPERPSSLKTQSVKSKTSGETLFVLTVGINLYSESSMKLEYANPDARAIAELFQKHATSVFKDVQVISLLDGQATRQGILDAVGTVARSARPDDTFAVFLAGHGSMLGQRYYFLPANFRGTVGNIADDIRAQALPADVLGDAVASVPAKRRLLIFDTCASGGAIQLNRQGIDPFAFRGAIEQLGQDGGTFTLAAVSSQQEAQEVRELGHGILSYCLLAAAGVVDSGPLQNRSVQPAAADRVVDVLEWFSYAAGYVPRLSRQYFGNEQQVQLGGQGKAFAVFGASQGR